MKEYQAYKDENFHPQSTGSPKRGQMNMTKIFLLQQVNVEKEYYKQDRVKFGMISCCNCGWLKPDRRYWVDWAEHGWVSIKIN